MQLEEAQADIEDIAIALYDRAPLLEIPTKEHLDVENKMYTREVFMPAGSIVVGEIHAKPCINILARGKLLVKKNVEDRGTIIEAPEDGAYTFSGKANERKIAYIIEDTIFINVFSNVEATCLEDIKAELIIPSEKLEAHIKNKELEWHS